MKFKKCTLLICTDFAVIHCRLYSVESIHLNKLRARVTDWSYNSAAPVAAAAATTTTTTTNDDDDNNNNNNNKAQAL
jgi:hypothetical protein